MRNPFAQGVQVTATPSKNRYTNSSLGLPSLPRSHSAGRTDVVVAPDIDEVPPSSVTKISDSVSKAKRPPTVTLAPSRQSGGNLLSSVEQTPTRGPSKFLGRPPSRSAGLKKGGDPIITDHDSTRPKLQRSITCGPSLDNLPSWSMNIQATPSKARGTQDAESRIDDSIQQTPEKAMLTKDTPVRHSPNAKSFPLVEQENSIYASLGWDDDIDDLA